MLATAPLKQGLRRLQPTPAHFTSFHAAYIKHCLLARTLYQAVDVLKDDITVFPHKKDHSTMEHYVLYRYYGGIVYTTLKRYSDALGYFNQALSVPAQRTSAVQVAAYRKWMLVYAIHHGLNGLKSLPTPKLTPLIVQRYVKGNIGKTYDAVFKVIKQVAVEKDVTKYVAALQLMDKAVEKHHHTLTQDGNVGLVQLVRERIPLACLQRLPTVYASLDVIKWYEQHGKGLFSSAQAVEQSLARLVCGGV
jgi:COP9 signalosome complex subunit 3